MTTSEPIRQLNPPGRSPSVWSRRVSWIVWGLFGLLALLLSWPLIANLTSRIPGTATWAFDESTFVWNIWYFKYALLNLHTSPLHSELIWYPLGIDLILYTYNFFNALIALPLQVAFTLPLASNLTLLLATTLSGFGAYLLALYVLRIAYCVDDNQRRDTEDGIRPTPHAPRPTHHVMRLAAILAGLIYAFASNRAIYAALGHYDMVTTQWLPFYALYLLKTLRGPKLKHAVLAGLFFALAALAEMIFASFLALLTVIIVLAAWRTHWGKAQPPALRVNRNASPGFEPSGGLVVEQPAKASIPKVLRAIFRAGWPAVIGRLLVIALVAGLIWAPVLVPVVREFLAGDYALEGWGEGIKLSADLAGLVTPTDLNLLGGRDGGLGPRSSQEDHWQAALRQVEEGKGRFGDINTGFLGYATLALALLGAWAGRRQLRAWAWSALVFGILVLGPLLQINGRYRFSLDNILPEGVTFPLPFALLHFIPFINANRAPNRNSVILMLALAVLASYGAAWLLARIDESTNQRISESASDATRNTHHAPRNTQYAIRITPPLVYLSTCLLAVLILAEHLAVPLPTTDARIPDIYRQIGQEPGQFAVLQLPLGWRNSFGVLGSEQTNLQYFQTATGKPMIGGNISRAPAFKMDYFARIPLFRALTDLEMYQAPSPELDAAARAQAGELMALYDVRYFITTPPIAGRYPYQDTWQATEDYALDVLPLEQPAFWAQDGYRAYRVIQPPVAFPFRIDLGAAGLEPYVGGGWDTGSQISDFGFQIDQTAALWATGRQAELYLPLAGPQDVTLRLRIAPLTYPVAPAQAVSVRVNDIEVVRKHALAAGWQTLEARVPAAAMRRGPNRVTLTFVWASSPRQVFPDPASRGVIGGTGVVSPVNIDAHGFDEAFISVFAVDGNEIKASAGRRGYNVTVIDPRTGQVLDMRGFDTAANAYEADSLASYLTGVPRGRIVAVATKGDASANLTSAAVQALRGLGSRAQTHADLSGMAHALVGVQGAAPGTAAESIAANDAFVRVAGDFRTLAAAVDWVEFGAGD